MGNSSTKESPGPGRSSRPGSFRNVSTSESSAQQGAPQSPTDVFINGLYGARHARGSRPDLSFLHIGNSNSDRDGTGLEPRRETKQEREARKLEKEKVAREKERERSIKEEGVDGGYLVTLGVYTGPEDYNKSIVRQLQIERRLAPFWKGLNDHNDSWVEHQLVAAVQGLPIPAADDIPPGMDTTASQLSDNHKTDNFPSHLMVPITGRSQSYHSDHSANLSSSHPNFPSATSPASMGSGSMPLFRGRAKTLASLTTSSRNNSAAQLTPQEMQLPKDPNVHGQPVEAYLYKDASECPICFMYYPPYLNKTRCCDQPICSECFVQIKRPDPHVPEHHDDPSNPQPAEPKPEEEVNLVSEPSQCPFCVTTEFGVTYEPPTFRRGLTYTGPSPSHPLLSNATSAMSSQTSLGSMVSRRRTHSLSATDKSVITTDRIRPDWAKKLADARAHALRRSAAATALHNAAYVLGGQGGDARILNLGRRRRTIFGDSPGGSGTGTPNNLSMLLGSANREIGGGDMDGTGRGNSRRTRVDDLEELMMMEAIRLSLAAEEDRKKKEDKDTKKEDKKKAKEAAKEAKKADKAAKKAGKAGSLYPASTNESTSTWASSSMVRSTSNLGETPLSSPPQTEGKGKGPAVGGFNPLEEPTSTLNTEMTKQDSGGKSFGNARQHLADSRATLQQASPSQPINLVPSRSHQRHFSGASSINSSVLDSAPGSYRNEAEFMPLTNVSGVDISTGAEQQQQQEQAPEQQQNAHLESMFNFRSLAAVIGEEDKDGHQAAHVENAETSAGAERAHDTTTVPSEDRSGVNGGKAATALEREVTTPTTPTTSGGQNMSANGSAPENDHTKAPSSVHV